MGIDTEAFKDAAKERVEKELAELNEKIVKLVAFLYGAEPPKITHTAKRLLVEQLSVMQQYSDILTRRLAVWDLPEYEARQINDSRARK